MNHSISNDHLSVEKVAEIINSKTELSLSEASRQQIIKCREFLDDMIERSDRPIYGITTGFGSLCNTSIGKADLGQLQRNLVTSHACGAGREVPSHVVKMMLLLKIQGLSYGHSGVAIETVERLIWHFNNDVLPIVYEQGSLGASGDLAPLAHLALPLIGLGEVRVNGQIRKTQDVLSEHQINPIRLQSKEGLALLNGTQFMSAMGIWCSIRGRRVMDSADIVGAMSLEAFDGRHEAFKDAVHAIRRHPGQQKVAKNIRNILKDSENFWEEKPHVQDPYSFRCIPQVHGACRDALEHFISVFENEINAVTDNPTVFPETGEVISAGNFHGEPLAINFDFLAVALAEIGSISERRIYKLVNGERGLPDFLVANPGLNSGFMIPQYTAASIVSKNKQLATPCSVDTIDSSNGQEDHVSMGANGAVKTMEILGNVETILGIEMMNACQALDFRDVSKTSSSIREIFKSFRKEVEFVSEDRELYPLIKESKEFVKSLQPENWLD